MAACGLRFEQNIFEYADPPCTDSTNRVCKSCLTCPVGTACYCPLASGICTGQADGDRTTCAACPAGKYRSAALVQQGVRECQACNACPAGYDKISECDRSIGTVQATNCRACGAETYRYESMATCQPCATCAATTERINVDCGIATQRTCTKCEDTTRSPRTNSPWCSRCADGYYPISGYNSAGERQGGCSLCSAAACGAGFWIRCFDGQRECKPCQGHTTTAGSTLCPLGQGVAGACDGTGTASVDCTACGAGTERLSTTPLLSGNVQVCAQCRTGRYKLAAGAGECGVCTNKPANSEYTAWGTAAATTASCPWCAGPFLILAFAGIAC